MSELQGLQSRLDEIRAADGEVVAICVDPVETNATVVEKLKLDFPILSDPDLKVTEAYDLRHGDAMTGNGSSDIARPGVFILDREGFVQWRDLTENWRIRVRPEEVLEQLAKIE